LKENFVESGAKRVNIYHLVDLEV